MRNLINYTAVIFVSFILISRPGWALDRGLMLVQNRADQSGELSVESLGFDKSTVAPSEDAKIIEKRTKKLQLHQKLGLLTLGLAAATALTAEDGKSGKPAPENHEHLGIATAASYFTTAYFSLTAPDLNEDKPRKGWNMKVHKAMAFIHFPCMLLLPFAGKQASDDYRDGKSPSGLGKEKKTLAGAALASLSVAALSVAIDF